MTRLYRDVTWLTQRYVDDKWSQQEIGEYCDVTQSTISKWIIKHNIESKAFSEGKFGNKNGSWVDSPYRESTKLYSLYVIDKLSIPKIAEISGHSNGTIQRWLRDANIETRSGSDKFVHDRSGESNSNWKGGLEVICPTCGKEKSRKASDCTSCYHDFRTANLYERAKNNKLILPISRTLRDLIKPWKHSILERDQYSCVSCSDTSKLYAHHIIPFYVIRDQLIMEYGSCIDFDFSTSENRLLFIDAVRDDSRLWDMDNGVTLCTSCHKGEHRRLAKQIDDALYTYKAVVIKNYDGDTLTVSIELGFGIHKETTVRLFGVNTNELTSSDIHKRGKAIAAKRAVEQLCQPGRQIVIRTYKAGKYGRWLALLMLDHAIVNDFLLDTGLAESYIL